MRKKRFLSFILAFSLLFGNLTIPNYTTKKAAASDSTTNYEGQSTNLHNQKQDPNWNEVAKKYHVDLGTKTEDGYEWNYGDIGIKYIEKTETLAFYNGGGCGTCPQILAPFGSNLNLADKVKHIVFNNIEEGFHGENLFSGYTKLESVKISGTLTLRRATNMFSGCKNLISIDTKNINISKTCDDISGMFYGCSSLADIDISNWDTAKIKNFGGMFHGCSSLTDKTGEQIVAMDTTNAIDIHNLLSNTKFSARIYEKIKQWGLSHMENISGLFSGTPISSFDLSNSNIQAKNISKLFAGCKSLTTLNLDNIISMKTENISELIRGCSKLTKLSMKNWDSSNVTNMDSVFEGTTSLDGIDISSLDMSSVKRANKMFYQAGAKSITLGCENTWGKMHQAMKMFADCDNLRSLSFHNADLSSIKSEFDNTHTDATDNTLIGNSCKINGFISNCDNLTSITIDGMKIGGDCMIDTFSCNKKLQTIVLKNINAENITAFSKTFYNCSELTSLDLSDINFGTLTNTNQMVLGCSKLQSINLSGLDFSAVKTKDFGFDTCSKLNTIICPDKAPKNVYLYEGDGSYRYVDKDYGTYKTLQANNLELNRVKSNETKPAPTLAPEVAEKVHETSAVEPTISPVSIPDNLEDLEVNEITEDYSESLANSVWSDYTNVEYFEYDGNIWVFSESTLLGCLKLGDKSIKTGKITIPYKSNTASTLMAYGDGTHSLFASVDASKITNITYIEKGTGSHTMFFQKHSLSELENLTDVSFFDNTADKNVSTVYLVSYALSDNASISGKVNVTIVGGKLAFANNSAFENTPIGTLRFQEVNDAGLNYGYAAGTSIEKLEMLNCKKNSITPRAYAYSSAPASATDAQAKSVFIESNVDSGSLELAANWNDTEELSIKMSKNATISVSSSSNSPSDTPTLKKISLYGYGTTYNLSSITMRQTVENYKTFVGSNSTVIVSDTIYDIEGENNSTIIFRGAQIKGEVDAWNVISESAPYVSGITDNNFTVRHDYSGDTMPAGSFKDITILGTATITKNGGIFYSGLYRCNSLYIQNLQAGTDGIIPYQFTDGQQQRCIVTIKNIVNSSGDILRTYRFAKGSSISGGFCRELHLPDGLIISCLNPNATGLSDGEFSPTFRYCFDVFDVDLSHMSYIGTSGPLFDFDRKDSDCVNFDSEITTPSFNGARFLFDCNHTNDNQSTKNTFYNNATLNFNDGFKMTNDHSRFAENNGKIKNWNFNDTDNDISFAKDMIWYLEGDSNIYLGKGFKNFVNTAETYAYDKGICASPYSYNATKINLTLGSTYGNVELGENELSSLGNQFESVTIKDGSTIHFDGFLDLENTQTLSKPGFTSIINPGSYYTGNYIKKLDLGRDVQNIGAIDMQCLLKAATSDNRLKSLYVRGLNTCVTDKQGNDYTDVSDLSNGSYLFDVVNADDGLTMYSHYNSKFYKTLTEAKKEGIIADYNFETLCELEEKPGTYIAPTMDSEGQRVVYCPECGYEEIEKIPKLKAQSVTFYTECNNDAATIQSFAEGRILDGTTLEDTNDITIDDTHVIITGDSVTTKEYNTTAGRIGYSFKGWYTDAALSEPLDTTSMITSDTTIYADMQKETYCIDYVTNGGTINSGKVDNYTHGDTVNLTQDVTKDGYTFVGWHYAKSLTDDVVTTIDANMGRDITLYAEWEANDFDYKVNHYILDTDGVHYTLKESETFTGKTDEEVTPSVKTYTGFTSPDTKTVTLLYGHDIVIDYYYTRNQYKVTLKKDENIQKTSGAGSYYYGEEVTIEATPKTGYSFSKWQDDNDVLSDNTVNNTSFILGDSDVTLEAKSLINQYDVSYIDWLDDTSVSNTDKLGSDVTALDYNSTVRGDDLGDDKTPGVYYKGRVYDRCTEETVGTDGATVYRYFKNASYKVTLDLNDGSGNIFDTVNVLYDNHYPAFKTPSRTGYTFLGWNTKSNGSGDMITEESIVNNDSDDTFYAIWKANIYTVFFDANGGTVTPEQKEVTYNTTYGELPIPTRTGYQFLRWLDDNNDEVTSDSIVTITKNQTLKASWKKMAHTLTFDAGKGSVSPSSKIVAYDDEYGELPTPVCKGYAFVEWNYKEDGTGDALNASDVVDTTEDETVYAIYKPITYTIQLDPDGGEVSTNVITYTIEDNVTLPDAGKRGYTFEGWGDKKITNIPKGTTGNLKFTAQYTMKVYTLTYNYGKGKLEDDKSNPDTYTVETEDFTINNPVLKGYSFTGWKVDGADAAVTFIIPKGTTGNKVLDATYRANKYKIYFDANGGSVEPKEIEATYDKAIGELPIPVRAGYSFNGWFLNTEEYTKSTVMKQTSDITLTAKWTANEHVVTFDAGKGGSVNPKTITVTYGAEYGKLPNATKIGYTFIGWNYKEDGTGETLNASDIVETTEDETVYAMYKPITYTIQLDPDGGEVSTNVITYTIEDDVTLPDARKRGYTFEGWGEKKITSLPKGTTGNLKFKATYNAIVYKISYDYNTGVLKNGQKNPDTYTVETEDFTINNPVRTGYNFIGWKIGTDEPQKEVTIHSGSIGDISMIAKYKAISHKVIFEPNGGNTPIKEKTVTYDESYGELPLPTKTGYAFIGWLNENEEKITDKTMVTTVEDETLTASWAPKQHNVSFDTDGGIDVEDIVVTFDKPYGKLPETQKEGYDFAGWVNVENKVVTKDDIVKTTEDETLTAVWKKKQYSVTCKDILGDSTHIDALLGETTWQAEYGSFESGSKLGTNTERGFYYKGRVYTSCTDGTVSSKGLTVYRIFKNATYKTTFDPNGGSLDTTSITTEYGEPLGDLPVPERTGHIFLGWIDEEDTPVTGTDITPDRDQTLTAVWAVKSFDVVYKDILGTPQNIKKVLGKSKKTANFGSKVSGAELGINTERNAYYAGYVYKSSTDAIVHNNDVVVYRIFDKAKFVINYDANGGEITNSTKTVVYDEPIGKLEIPNKPGNNFITWKDGDDAITPNTIYTKTTDTTITAYYEPIPAVKPTASPTPTKEPAPTPSAPARPTVTPKSVVPDAYLVFSKTINKGDAFKIKTLNTKGCKVSWTASKKGIVKVKGMTIKAKKNGHTKLRCTVTNKKKVVVYRFGIDITVKKTGVHTLNTNKKRKSDWGRPEMLLDKTIFTNTKWKVKFKNTKNAKITYKVKNHRVVKVNKKTNTIYPKKVGYTFMTITVKQNGKTTKYMMHIKVQKPIK